MKSVSRMNVSLPVPPTALPIPDAFAKEPRVTEDDPSVMSLVRLRTSIEETPWNAVSVMFVCAVVIASVSTPVPPMMVSTLLIS